MQKTMVLVSAPPEIAATGRSHVQEESFPDSGEEWEL